jgi:hypothetical protein
VERRGYPGWRLRGGGLRGWGGLRSRGFFGGRRLGYRSPCRFSGGGWCRLGGYGGFRGRGGARGRLHFVNLVLEILDPRQEGFFRGGGFGGDRGLGLSGWGESFGAVAEFAELWISWGYFDTFGDGLEGVFAEALVDKQLGSLLELLNGFQVFAGLVKEPTKDEMGKGVGEIGFEKILAGLNGRLEFFVLVVVVDNPLELFDGGVGATHAGEQEGKLFAGLDGSGLEHDEDVVDGERAFEFAADGVGFGGFEVFAVGLILLIEFKVEGGEFAAGDFVAGVLFAGVLEIREGLFLASLVDEHFASEDEIPVAAFLRDEAVGHFGDLALEVHGEEFDEDSAVMGRAGGVLAFEGFLFGVEDQRLAYEVLVDRAMDPDEGSFAVNGSGGESHFLQHRHRIQPVVVFEILFGELILARHTRSAGPPSPRIISLCLTVFRKWGKAFSEVIGAKRLEIRRMRP